LWMQTARHIPPSCPGLTRASMQSFHQHRWCDWSVRRVTMDCRVKPGNDG